MWDNFCPYDTPFATSRHIESPADGTEKRNYVFEVRYLWALDCSDKCCIRYKKIRISLHWTARTTGHQWKELPGNEGFYSCENCPARCVKSEIPCHIASYTSIIGSLTSSFTGRIPKLTREAVSNNSARSVKHSWNFGIACTKTNHQRVLKLM